MPITCVPVTVLPYMVEERRSDLLETSFNSTLNKQFNRHLGLTAGVGARFTQSRQFKTVDDLLGSNYVLDIDKFAERDFSGDHDKLQNDLNRPDRKVYKDGIFGYNFNLNIYSANAWAVNRFRALAEAYCSQQPRRPQGQGRP